MNVNTSEVQPLKLWELLLLNHLFTKYSMMLFGVTASGQQRPDDFTVNIQEVFWPESHSRRAAVFSINGVA